MKNVIKIFILAFAIGLSGCTGFYVSDNMHYDYQYQNKYSIYNPYYSHYNTVTFINPINNGYRNNHTTQHHHHNNQNNLQHLQIHILHQQVVYHFHSTIIFLLLLTLCVILLLSSSLI